MSYINFNGNLIDEKSAFIHHTNRKFKYGDGFFETIVVDQNQINHWSYHWDRMVRAFKVLDYTPLPEKKLVSDIHELLKKNGLQSGIVNIQCWRSEGGLYTPEKSSVEFLIAARSDLNKISNSNQNQPLKAGICRSVFTHQSPWSFFKNESLVYVLAGREMKKHNWDDIILLDNEGNIAECLFSNIFWRKHHIYYTPDLKTGCIDGVRRRVLIDRLTSESKQIEFGRWKPEALLEADEIFRTNAIGIHPISIEGKV